MYSSPTGPHFVDGKTKAQGGQVSAHGHPSRKPQFCLTPEALAFPVCHREASPTVSLWVSRCARKGVGRLTISLPAPWRPWLVQTAGSPGFPLCQSASYRKTEEKRAGWRGCPPWLSSPHLDKEHITESEMVGEWRSLACHGRRHMQHVSRNPCVPSRQGDRTTQRHEDDAQMMGGQPGSGRFPGEGQSPLGLCLW